MSFILDALKKSESERQRQSGPALFEVKVAPPRSRFTLWAVGLGALLLVNVAVVGWVFLHNSSKPTAAAATPTESATSGLSRASAVVAPTASAPDTRLAMAPAAPPVAPPPANAAEATAPAHIAAAAQAAAGTAPAEASNRDDDDAPAVEPARSAAPKSDEGVVRATSSGLPRYQDAAAVPGANLPELRLDLHTYAAQPDQRFVFINMTLLHEGDSTPQGVRVDNITPDGAILSYHGTRFVLTR
jgi:general secretion pathway protein B